jgi:hypothetical protein
VLLHLVLVLPGIALYLAYCSSLAVDHFSRGFMALQRDGVIVRAHEYSRDSKSIHLLPMVHVAEPGFYQQVSLAPDTNAVFLLEGVTDRENLLRHKLSYQRMASTLGLAEQQEQFDPGTNRVRRADVDVSQFSSSTVEFINLAARIHAGGLSLELIRDLLTSSQAPALTDQLWADLLTLRNTHLAEEISAELRRSDLVIVPWGAAHMPGLAREIENMGFRLVRTKEVQAIRFRTLWERAFKARAPLRRAESGAGWLKRTPDRAVEFPKRLSASGRAAHATRTPLKTARARLRPALDLALSPQNRL